MPPPEPNEDEKSGYGVEPEPSWVATAERIIAEKTNRLNTLDKTMCIVSLNPASIHRELIANTVWVGMPTRPAPIRDTPAQRMLFFSPARQTPTPKAAITTLWMRITDIIKERTGEPNADSSLMA